MIEIDKIDDFPKLVPDKRIRFEAKDEIRRAPEMDFECTEREYKDMLAEDEIVKRYNIRLSPDMEIVMPDKMSLKRTTTVPRLLWLSVAVVVAAIIALVLIVTKNKNSDIPDVATVTAPKVKSDIIVRVEPSTETETQPKPRVGVTTKKKKTVPVTKSIPEQLEPVAVEPDIVEHVARPEDIRIERIESTFVPVEMMNREKTVFVYQRDVQQNIILKTVTDIASMTDRFVADIDEAKLNIAQKLDKFILPNLLNRLSLDRGIDREIDEWAKNNPDIPFNVFIDYLSENKMTKIFDENGTLIKVIFFTNGSLKYRSDKTYQASK
jgi:hypothetical protein